jgi:hypothetical protein
MSTLIHEGSLSATVDAVSEAVFLGRTIPVKERREAARWIASRQGLPGAYGQLFAGFASELDSGIRVFTGERITCASARHILGEESCRAILLLDSHDSTAAAALTRATKWLTNRVGQAARDSPRNNLGTYCCGKCTVGLWRNILAGGLDRCDVRLGLGLSTLRSRRDGKGEWRTFPFWYTTLALTEMNRPEARRELQYAVERIKVEAKRSPGSVSYARRRNAVAQRALDRL